MLNPIKHPCFPNKIDTKGPATSLVKQKLKKSNGGEEIRLRQDLREEKKNPDYKIRMTRMMKVMMRMTSCLHHLYSTYSGPDTLLSTSLM